MQIPLIQIDAFADRLFAGNPAAMMPLTAWPPDATLLSLAAENNLSETAFLLPDLPAEATAQPAPGPAYHLRWFTPAIEVDLCGHATLAAAAYLLDDVHPDDGGVCFWTRSGWLPVQRDGPGRLRMDFPATTLVAAEPDPEVVTALGTSPQQAFQGIDLVYVYDDARAIRRLDPDFTRMRGLPYRGVSVTAPGDLDGVDFVSRFFGCAAGVGEDPVTGSAHAQLAPWWSERLGRTRLVAHQVSQRGGRVDCEVTGGRVLLTGTYVRYLTGVATIG